MGTAKITVTPQLHWNKDKIELEVTNGYEITVENGKYYIVKNKPQYPKTYVDCCEMLKINPFSNEVYGYERDLISALQTLITCRNAYWKIAGKELGLDKPWEPDWCNENKLKYCIECSFGTIDKTRSIVNGCFLAFPTEEMRDTFYENFKELVEQCKELL